MAKPKVALSGAALPQNKWWCHGMYGCGFGATPNEAYDNWLLNISDANERKHYAEIANKPTEDAGSRKQKDYRCMAMRW